MKNSWYDIYLVSKELKTRVATVKSKGLAYILEGATKKVYKDTEYKVVTEINEEN